jgi:hypothetical protein
MKRILKELANTQCTTDHITLSEHNAMTTNDPQYKDLQRFHAGITHFENSDDVNAGLPCSNKITNWVKKTGKKTWKVECENGKTTEIFVKAAPILNPIGFLKGEYELPKNPYLPTDGFLWKETLNKINSPNNQAYVDTVCAFVVSRFREKDLMPHFPLFYGSASAIASPFEYKLTDEFETYRARKWFWRGVEEHSAILEISPDDSDLHDLVLKCPFTKEELAAEDTSSDVSSELSSLAEDQVGEIKDDLEEVTSLDDLTSQSSSSGESSSVETEEPAYEILLKIPNLPVALIYQEAHDGTMDELLDEDEIDGIKRNTKAWELRWTAWIWQVIASLAFLQRTIGFTHNDLHTNNIVWRKTKKEYLYYRTHKGTIWRVPTFGKIFALIDFGRAIFKLGDKKWLSDDFQPGEDAHGQYNFGPIYDKGMPKITPNYSFDLCRLAISLIDGLYPDVEKPDSELFKLLWGWTLDNEGNTVYEDLEGEERYSGFELYVRIAADCSNAVPRDQLECDIFNRFKFTSGSMPEGTKAYHIV